MFFRLRGKDFAVNAASRNRSGLRALTERADASGGLPPGLVGYLEGQPVGWVSLGPREDYERLRHSTTLRPVDDRPVWSIVCFVVGRHSRGEGIAGALLDGAIAFARDRGAPALEAYPTATDGARKPDASLYRGTLSMFEARGFRTVGWSEPYGANAPRPIVRLELSRPAGKRPTRGATGCRRGPAKPSRRPVGMDK